MLGAIIKKKGSERKGLVVSATKHYGRTSSTCGVLWLDSIMPTDEVRAEDIETMPASTDDKIEEALRRAFEVHPTRGYDEKITQDKLAEAAAALKEAYARSPRSAAETVYELLRHLGAD